LRPNAALRATLCESHRSSRRTDVWTAPLIFDGAIARVDGPRVLPYRPESGFFPRGGGWLGGQRYLD